MLGNIRTYLVRIFSNTLFIDRYIPNVKQGNIQLHVARIYSYEFS